VDLVVLAGWMRIFSGPFLEYFASRVITSTPPSCRGASGDNYTLTSGEQNPRLPSNALHPKWPSHGRPHHRSSVHYVHPDVDAGR